MCDELQSLLNVVWRHFSKPDCMKVLEVVKLKADGIENWFQIEVLTALDNNGFPATVWGKTNYDADLVVQISEKKVGIELRCWKETGADSLTPVIRDHPKANLYLFLAQPIFPISSVVSPYRQDSST